MTIFSKIISGELPCYKVAEDEQNFAFLDINPLVEGHTVVVPKVEVDRFFDLSPDSLSSLMQFAQRIARKIESEIECHRVAVCVIGLEVPHAHVHLIPMVNGASDVDFKNPRKEFSAEEFAEIARKIAP